MGDIYSLETPENVAVGYDVAGVGSRFLAILIDSILQTLVMIAVWIVAAVAGANLGGRGLYVALAVGTLIITVVLLGYFVFFELIWNGQSPGKRAMGLRVILTSGYPVTPLAVVIRNVLRLVDWLPSLYAVGVITMIANRRSRRLGDLVAGTMVIKEGREGNLASLPSLQMRHTTALPTPYGAQAAPSAQPYGSAATPSQTYGGGSAPPLPPYGPGASSSPYGPGVPPPSPYGAAAVPPSPLIAGGAQLERLTREDEALIRDFLSRRGTLTPARRDELARQIAAVVHRRIGGPSPLYGPERPEFYLEQVLAAREARGRL